MNAREMADAIEALKQEWLKDPCWDIEDTEGFEEHRAELLLFRREKELDWKLERLAKLSGFARRIGVDGENLRLAEYLEALEARIRRLEEKAS